MIETMIKQYCLRFEGWLKQEFELNDRLNKKEKNGIKSECEYATNAQNTICMNRPKNIFKVNLAASQGGLSGLSSLRSDGSQESQMWG